jgi:hypothetical protein
MALTIDTVWTQAEPIITETETNLEAMIATLGPNTSAGDMLKLQAYMTKSSTAVSIFSSVMKERSDTVKGCCQKM